MITYGVFCGDVLIFSDEETYAIYGNENVAESFMREMQSRFNRSDYNVRSIELNVKVAYGGSYYDGKG
jgi:hypothetical protein